MKQYIPINWRLIGCAIFIVSSSFRPRLLAESGPGPPPDPSPRKEIVPGVFFFGDSIIDTGNNNNLTTEMRCNFPPYGKNFPNGVATGRFSDGKVASDYISEYLGLNPIVPAYFDPKIKAEDLLKGVSFASGGSGYYHLTPKLSNVISMVDQLTYFQHYVERVKRLVGQNKTEQLLTQGLAITVAGSNDLIITYFGKGSQDLRYDIHYFTSMMANSAASFVTELYEIGVRQIGVIGTPPLGCVPLERTVRGGLHRDCAQDLNYASQLFNAKLSIALDQLATTLPNSNIMYIDNYSPFSHILQNPAQYGFENIKKGCCGTGLVEVGPLCNPFTSILCSNISAFLFWDSFHPTQRFYKILAKIIFDRNVHRLN